MPLKRHPVAVSNIIEALAGLPLDNALIQSLRTTYERVRAEEMRLATLFYTRLFSAAPALRGMFKGDLSAQAAKLTGALDAVVQNLERPRENAEMLAELGRRHAAYGAKPEHYDLVVDLLVQSMREVLQAGDDDRAIREWRMALRLIADQMIAASEAGSVARPSQDR